MRTFLVILIAVSTVMGCSQKSEKTRGLESGIWRASLNIGDHELPFNFMLSQEEDLQIEIINAEERIKVKEIEQKGDSIWIRMPVFHSEFIAHIVSPTEMKGQWFNYAKAPDYSIPFKAKAGDPKRFPEATDPQSSGMAGKWEVTFSPGTEGAYPAVGIFKVAEEKVTGTFLTETGDYRYLEGGLNGKELMLSCFDGAHAFLFRANLGGDDTLRGTFWSGKHFQEPWKAFLSEAATLRDPESLTYLKDGYNGVAFTFPDLDSSLVSLSDDKYKDKVVMIQLLGSWCPNCMDETRAYTDFYKKYNGQGLEIIGLCYERTPNFAQAVKNVEKFKGHLGADYDFLIAGTSRKTDAGKTLPMLNHIMSFPTTIFMDQKGVIRKIHTGFYGPGTGEYYDRFVDETNTFISELLKEG